MVPQGSLEILGKGLLEVPVVEQAREPVPIGQLLELAVFLLQGLVKLLDPKMGVDPGHQFGPRQRA